MESNHPQNTSILTNLVHSHIKDADDDKLYYDMLINLNSELTNNTIDILNKVQRILLVSYHHGNNSIYSTDATYKNGYDQKIGKDLLGKILIQEIINHENLPLKFTQEIELHDNRSYDEITLSFELNTAEMEK